LHEVRLQPEACFRLLLSDSFLSIALELSLICIGMSIHTQPNGVRPNRVEGTLRRLEAVQASMDRLCLLIALAVIFNNISKKHAVLNPKTRNASPVQDGILIQFFPRFEFSAHGEFRPVISSPAECRSAFPAPQ